jgi:predicted RNA-binding protein associated with RNAse of E/G family
MNGPRRARIHYLRLPDDEQVFDQPIVHQRDDVIVTLTDPLVVRGRPPEGAGPMLETGSRVVWFTFPERWHDVGLFHGPHGSFRGYYTNILTPPHMDGTTWHTTDLFLDVWCPVGRGAMLLDEDELERALALGQIGADLAGAARAEANRVLELARQGHWPPAVVREWTLERALQAVR